MDFFPAMANTSQRGLDWRIRMAGDSAITVDFGSQIDSDVNARVLSVAAEVRSMRLEGVRDIVPSYSSVTIYIDPLCTAVDRLWGRLEVAVVAPVSGRGPSREILVPVSYGGSDGPDLDEVAGFANCSTEQVIRLHTSPRYRVYMLGFLPGFPYLGPVDSRIAMPRRQSPRLAVPAGSVGVAGPQTGIYPTVAPGGWRLIGRTLVEVFDSGREPPCLFRPGDFVRFEAVPGTSR